MIHAGIYYPQGSLKARLCTAGRELLYAFCSRYRVPHRRCGKVIIAIAAGQQGSLKAIEAVAASDGVEPTQLDRRAPLGLEPDPAGVAGLLCPVIGIMDCRAYMLTFIGLLERYGGAVVYGSRVSRIWLQKDGVAAGLNGGGAGAASPWCRQLRWACRYRGGWRVPRGRVAGQLSGQRKLFLGRRPRPLQTSDLPDP